MKIYTKTGDDGTTGLSGGMRVSKSSSRIIALGDVDETNAALGLAAVCNESEDLRSAILWIQARLFDLGAELSCPPGGRVQFSAIDQIAVERLEASIDELTEQLEPLSNFILPGGSELAARLHVARTICRRAERSCLVLNDRESLRPELLMFLNRLSDWLFVVARTANSRQNVEDIRWSAEP